jgi:hypothetical protein
LIDFDFAQLREIIDDVLPLQILVAPFRKAIEDLRTMARKLQKCDRG